MKKIILCLLCAAATLLTGCAKEEAPSSTESILSETTAQVSEREYTKEEILDFFNGYAYADPDGRKAVDCVAVTDGAYDLMGIVLFTTEEKPGCGLDYLRKDGTLAGHTGLEAALAEKAQLTYLGNGMISLRLLKEDRAPYTCRIQYTCDENGTNFTVETI